MTDKDLEVCRRVFAEWAASQGLRVRRVLLICPDRAQEELAAELFPTAERLSVFYPGHDCSAGPPPGGPWDVVMLSNTLMCATDPAKWLEHLLSSCKEIWMQELVRAWRNGEHGELAPESGDVCRFTFPLRGQLARVDTAYDLEANPEVSVDAVEFYGDNGAGEGKDCLKFVARVTKRGEKLTDAGVTGGRADVRPAPRAPRRKDGQTG